jgi:hypothetical protein
MTEECDLGAWCRDIDLWLVESAPLIERMSAIEELYGVPVPAGSRGCGRFRSVPRSHRDRDRRLRARRSALARADRSFEVDAEELTELAQH